MQRRDFLDLDARSGWLKALLGPATGHEVG
jgi:hypothetical protein